VPNSTISIIYATLANVGSRIDQKRAVLSRLLTPADSISDERIIALLVFLHIGSETTHGQS